MADIPICPLLSIRSQEADELCLEEGCALYLPQAKKCSLVYIGYKALVEVQRMQQAQPQQPQAQQARPQQAQQPRPQQAAPPQQQPPRPAQG